MKTKINGRRFYLHQRRGHHQEIPGQVDIEALEHLHVSQVLLGDPGNGDVVDIDLFFADQIQQQIQRPREYFKIYAIPGQLSLLLVVRFEDFPCPLGLAFESLQLQVQQRGNSTVYVRYVLPGNNGPDAEVGQQLPGHLRINRVGESGNCNESVFQD